MNKKIKKVVREVRKPVQQRSINKRKQLIDAAISLIKEKGFLAIGIRDIVSKANMSIGTYYSYFKDKNDIFREVITILSIDYFEAFVAEVKAKMSKTKNIEELVYFMITNLQEKFTNNLYLYREVQILALTDESFNVMYNNFRLQRAKSLSDVMWHHFKNRIALRDPDAAMIVMFKFVEEITKHIVFNPAWIEEERVKREAAAMICSYIESQTPADSKNRK
jgi:AcrR family transcriptional regulator